ncbi:MAG TPA: M48 family metalloprotease, partial [Pyrinomonadaceae bacterium]|nr:M48 family metalloprotease [Pyrinomonadaceae bacterium]
MSRKIFPYFFSLLLLLTVYAAPLRAQQADCLPPVALPAATEANIFNPEQEVMLGEVAAERIQKDYRVIEDPQLLSFLNQIGERLNKNLPLSSLRLRFFLVDLPDANAFVLPGGRIYVSRKLVALTRSEDELA